MSRISLSALVAWLGWAARVQAAVLVGGSTLNGDFNADPGPTLNFADTANWYNLGGAQTVQCTRDDLTYDGTQNAVVTVDRKFSLDTGHTIAEGDAFSISYLWRDAWNWVDASDQLEVALFVTDDNTLTGLRTDLVVNGSGPSTQDSTYEPVFHSGIHVAPAYTNKTLFVVIETVSSGFARLDNFQLTLQEPTNYYVAASGDNANDGLSPATAWENVDALDGRGFIPGDQILFNRGDTFPGACTLLGSGASNQVITVGAYGTGDKPHLTGAPGDARIFLLDTGNQYIEFRDLHLSNFNTSNASIPEREVIKVEPPAGSGEINHLYFQDLDVSDVQGYGRPVQEDDHRSYAIFLETVNDDGNPTRFNHVRCENSTFSNIDGRAFTINDPSQSLADWRNGGTPYYPSVSCVFQGNYGTNIYRNMAMVSGTQGFLMQGNTMDTTVEGSAFWPYNAEGTVVQYNLFMNIFAYDADAYVCHFDYNCVDTLMQYNIGVNVEGGLIEIIKAMWSGAFQEGAVARYNLGIDVGYRNRNNSAGIFLTGDVVDSRVYNNTIIQLSKPQYKAISFNDGWNGPSGWPVNSGIFNNIFYAADTPSTYHENSYFDDFGNLLSYNLYYGNLAPPPEDANPFTADPLFANPSGLDAQDFKVTFGSAAIANGRLIPNNGGRDYFGYDVLSNAAPTLGFHEYLSDPVIDSDGDKMPDLWESTYSLNPGDPSDAADHSDSDWLVNLYEFALGGNPMDGNDTGHPRSWSRSGEDLFYVYPRRIDSALSYWLETNPDLASIVWTNSGYSELPETGTLDADFEAVTNAVSATGSTGFVRLRIE